MTERKIYVEGGGRSKELKARCREGFHKLLEKSVLAGRVPRIVPCGSRNEAFDDFKTAHAQRNLKYAALLVDSEDPVMDMEKTWDHLKALDGWTRPVGAANDQVFLMTTCMETWLVADRDALKKHYKGCLQVTALPTTIDLEQRDRKDVQDRLTGATRTCTNAYTKDKRSFQALTNATPDALTQTLPSFARMLRILDHKLP